MRIFVYLLQTRHYGLWGVFCMCILYLMTDLQQSHLFLLGANKFTIVQWDTHLCISSSCAYAFHPVLSKKTWLDGILGTQVLGIKLSISDWVIHINSWIRIITIESTRLARFNEGVWLNWTHSFALLIVSFNLTTFQCGNLWQYLHLEQHFGLVAKKIEFIWLIFRLCASLCVYWRVSLFQSLENVCLQNQNCDVITKLSVIVFLSSSFNLELPACYKLDLMKHS